jgi:hypothetical protein
LPPLNVSKREINLALKILENVSRNFKWKILSIFLIYHRMNLDQL